MITKINLNTFPILIDSSNSAIVALKSLQVYFRVKQMNYIIPSSINR